MSAASQPAPQAPPGRAAGGGERIGRGELLNERRFVYRRLHGALTRRAAPRTPLRLDSVPPVAAAQRGLANPIPDPASGRSVRKR